MKLNLALSALFVLALSGISAADVPYVTAPNQSNTPLPQTQDKQIPYDVRDNHCKTEKAVAYMTFSRKAEGRSLDVIMGEILSYCRGDQFCMEHRRNVTNNAYWNVPIPTVSPKPYYNPNYPTQEAAAAMYLHSMEARRQMAAIEREGNAIYDSCMLRLKDIRLQTPP